MVGTADSCSESSPVSNALRIIGSSQAGSSPAAASTRLSPSSSADPSSRDPRLKNFNPRQTSMRNAKTANTTSMSTRDNHRLEPTVSGTAIISLSLIPCFRLERVWLPSMLRQTTPTTTPIGLIYCITFQMNQRSDRRSCRHIFTKKQGSDLRGRRPDALGEQPDAVRVDRVGQERQRVLGKSRDICGLQLRKNIAPVPGLLDHANAWQMNNMTREWTGSANARSMLTPAPL